MAVNNDPQVVVIGGGPAGATASTLLAQQGIKVELYEREQFPRFHIGESLIPETYWVLKRLNMLDKMKASHFVKSTACSLSMRAERHRLHFTFSRTNRTNALKRGRLN